MDLEPLRTHTALALVRPPPADRVADRETPSGIVALFALLYLWTRSDYLLELPLPKELTGALWVLVDVSLVVALFATAGMHRAAWRWGWTFLAVDALLALWYHRVGDLVPSCSLYYALDAVVSVAIGVVLAFALGHRLARSDTLRYGGWTVVFGVVCGWVATDVATAIQAPHECADGFSPHVAMDFYVQASQIIATLVVAVLVDLTLSAGRRERPAGVDPTVVVVLLALVTAALGLAFSLSVTAQSGDYAPALTFTVAAVAQLVAALGVLVVARLRA
jgi:hypothetical protein